MAKLERILVPIDFSEESKEALNYAIFMAQNTNATIDLLHIWTQPRYLDAQTMFYEPEGAEQSLAQYMEAQAAEEMEKFLAHRLKDDKLTINKRVESGEPDQTISEIAEQEKFDLIIMGTHGRTGVSHALLGSIAEKVVRNSVCPVLTLRSDHLDPRNKYEHKDLVPLT